jgi:cytochrome c biogenesis protein CcmG, thiol:disulfide interchange protein DsbE
MKKIFPVVIVLLLIGIGAWFVKEYKTVPELPFYESNVVDESGQSIKFSDIKDQYILISYFQTWCGSCIHELQGFDELQMRVGKNKLKVMLVSDEEMKKIIRFKEKYCNTLDYYQSVKSLNDLDIRVFPTTYLLDNKGAILMSKLDYYDWNNEEVYKLFR